MSRKQKREGLIFTLAGLAFIICSVTVACSANGAPASLGAAAMFLTCGCALTVVGLTKLEKANRGPRRR